MEKILNVILKSFTFSGSVYIIKLRIKINLATLTNEVFKMEKVFRKEIRPIMEKLNSSQINKEVFFCDREIFKMVYKLEKKRKERSKSSSYILNLKVIGEGLDGVELERIASRMLKIFENKLRPGDAVCKLDKNNFVLLINNIEEKILQMIIKRINYSFYSLKSLNNRTVWIDLFKRSGLVWDYKII